MDAGVHAMGDDHGMSIDDESHRKPSPFRSAQESSAPVAPRALSIDEEWAVIMALEEERAAHTRLSRQPLQRQRPFRRI